MCNVSMPCSRVGPSPSWDAGLHGAGVIDGHDGDVGVLESLVEFSP